MSTELANQSFMHAITAKEITKKTIKEPFATKELLATKEPLITKGTEQNPFIYINIQYTSKEFYDVIINTGASCCLTAGYKQYLAYKKINSKDIEINTIQARAVNVQFGIGSTLSIGTIVVNTPIGNIDFHIIQADTPFLLCLKDMDLLKAYCWYHLVVIFVLSRYQMARDIIIYIISLCFLMVTSFL